MRHVTAVIGVGLGLWLTGASVHADSWHREHGAVLEQVRDWFPHAYMAPRPGPAGAFYRVRVGPFTDKAVAQRIASGLTRGGHHVFLDEVPETALPSEAPQPSSGSK